MSEDGSIRDQIDGIIERLRPLKQELSDIKKYLKEFEDDDDVKAFELIFKASEEKLEEEKRIVSEKNDRIVELEKEIAELEREKNAYVFELMKSKKQLACNFYNFQGGTHG